MALKLKKRNLSEYDLEIGIDNSGSTVSYRDTPSKGTRMDEQKKIARVAITEMSTIDEDGITIWTFGMKLERVQENTTEKNAQSILNSCNGNGDGTDQAAALGARLDDYLEQLLGTPDTKTKSWLGGEKVVKGKPANPNTKPRIFVVITDGEPSYHSGRAALEKVIRDATWRLYDAGYGREKLGISFIQSGRDATAAAFLEHLNKTLGLPEGMDPKTADRSKYAAFDCVNALTMDEAVGLDAVQILEKALDD